jgi:UDP-GlcNAc:undecaprenyl-phosphate GlcNAc-1-phosphate transferase
MLKYLTFFFISAGGSLLLTPLIRAFAKWANICDIPNERKIHKKPVPLLGGIPIFASFNLTVILVLIFDHSYLNELLLANWEALLICQIVILGLGLYDDVKKLQPGAKILFQILAGSLIVAFGLGIKTISNPITGQLVYLGALSIPVTIIWLVGITNALNLVDGLDGLAAGTSLIACLTIFAISFFNQNTGQAVVALVLAGSIVGFLRYNFYPAKIFLGDSGSLLLGFLLAVLSIQGYSKGATLVAVLAPILGLGFPIMETLLSMIRRLFKAIHMVDYSTEKGNFHGLIFKRLALFGADTDHMHHRLLKLGLSQRKAVVILYGICVILSVLAFLCAALKDLNIIALMGAILIAFLIGVRSLKYQEFKILENGLLIPLFSFPIINRRLFQAFFDLVMIALSDYLSFVIVFGGLGGQAKDLFIQSLPVLLLGKIVVFYILGLYRGSWTYSSLEETLSLLGIVFLSSLTAFFVLTGIFGLRPFGGPSFFVLDFYLLLTFVGGFRFANQILNGYYNRSFAQKGKNVLIYGAGYKGSTVLREIRHNGTYMFSPVGFVDDDPDKKGKMMHGCPILGSVEDLEHILTKSEISEIIVSTAKIESGKIRKLIDFCKNRGIIIRQFEYRFYEFP